MGRLPSSLPASISSTAVLNTRVRNLTIGEGKESLKRNLPPCTRSERWRPRWRRDVFWWNSRLPRGEIRSSKFLRIFAPFFDHLLPAFFLPGDKLIILPKKSQRASIILRMRFLLNLVNQRKIERIAVGQPDTADIVADQIALSIRGIPGSRM